jgi:hypothetical protein
MLLSKLKQQQSPSDEQFALVEEAEDALALVEEAEDALALLGEAEAEDALAEDALATRLLGEAEARLLGEAMLHAPQHW